MQHEPETQTGHQGSDEGADPSNDLQRQNPGETMTADQVGPTTETDRPNISTDHQREGDARRPSDTLDRDRPEDTAEHSADREPSGGLEQADVEDRPNVSSVTPDDYPGDRPDS